MKDDVPAWLQFDAVVFDESHKIGNRSKQTKAAVKLGRRARYRLAATGTPITKNPLNLFTQAEALDESLGSANWFAFRDRYMTADKWGGVKEWKNLDELERRFGEFGYRLTKAEAVDLPPKVYQEIRIQLEGDQLHAYREMEDNFAVWFDRQAESGKAVTATSVLPWLLRLTQISSGFVGGIRSLSGEDETVAIADGELFRDAQRDEIRFFENQAKLDALAELIETHLANPARKMVVFARFHADIDRIVNLAERAGVTAAPIDGRVKAQDRNDVIERFQKSDHPRLLAVQNETGGLGITLHRADVAVMYSQSFQYGSRVQSEDRLHRIGQVADRVLIVDLLAEGTVDEKVKENLSAKRELAEAITGDKIRSWIKAGSPK